MARDRSPHNRFFCYDYESLAKFAKLGLKHETALRSAFQELLETVIDLLDAPVFFINDTSTLGLPYEESCQRH
ncbi:MAG: hypothetical protein ABSH34_35050 [Verrucomicrobiota bacterium]|jgi:hypothetical protein